MNEQARILAQLRYSALSQLIWAMEDAKTLEGGDWCFAEHKLLADLHTARNHKEESV